VRLSRDKVNKLAHSVMDALTRLESVEFIEDPNTIRMETRRVLEELLAAEEKIDLAAHHHRRHAGVGHPLSQVLQRRSQEAGNLENW
jgi:hypothetical protein